MSLKVEVRLARQGFQHSIRLKCPAASVTGVIGASGSGKTSLLRSIAGFERQACANITFNGDVWQQDTYFLPTYQRRLGFVFQEASLFEHLTVEQNLQFAIERSNRVGNREGTSNVDKAKAANLLGIEALFARSCLSLSGGERQRVAIARTLCSQPRLLLMDEPLSALDGDSKSEILPFLESVCQEAEVPVLYVSHSIDEVARLSDYLVLMSNGAVVANQETASVLSSLDLPLSKQADAASIIEGTVESKDNDYGLTILSTEAGRLTLSQTDGLTIGQRVRVKLAARDISVSLSKSADSSILNSIEATIQQVQNIDKSQTVVKLCANGAPILAKITRKSCDQLSLQAGMSVVLQIKSIALL